MDSPSASASDSLTAEERRRRIEAFQQQLHQLSVSNNTGGDGGDGDDDGAFNDTAIIEEDTPARNNAINATSAVGGADAGTAAHKDGNAKKNTTSRQSTSNKNKTNATTANATGVAGVKSSRHNDTTRTARNLGATARNEKDLGATATAVLTSIAAADTPFTGSRQSLRFQSSGAVGPNPYLGSIDYASAARRGGGGGWLGGTSASGSRGLGGTYNNTVNGKRKVSDNPLASPCRIPGVGVNSDDDDSDSSSDGDGDGASETRRSDEVPTIVTSTGGARSKAQQQQQQQRPSASSPSLPYPHGADDGGGASNASGNNANAPFGGAAEPSSSSAAVPAVGDADNASVDDGKAKRKKKKKKKTKGKKGKAKGEGDGDVEEGEEEEEEPPRVTLREIFKYATTTDRVMMVLGGISAFIAGAGMPAFSEVLGRMISDLTSSGGSIEDAMSETALIMVYVGLVTMFFATFQVSFWMLAASRQVTRVRILFFEAVMRQDIGWHDEHKPGELISRMDGDTRVLQNGINDKFANGIYQLGMMLCGFGLGFYRSWELTLLMLGTMPLLAVVGALSGYVMTAMTEKSREGYAVAGAIATEVMENVRTVQAFGQEEHEVQRFADAAKPAEEAGIRRELTSNASVGLTNLVLFCCYGIAFWFASYLIEWGRRDVADILACFYAVLFASFAVGLIFPPISAFTEACASAYKLFGIIDRVPPIDIQEQGKPIAPELADGIVFEDVAFAYPTRKDHELFKKLNVTIKKGQTVAFSGVSGSGKSSIIQMIQRFYDPDGGKVLVDGVDMRDIDLFGWRDQIGIVSQEPSLFAGTIADNVRVGKESATDAEVEEACRKANIHDVIMTLPERYDTNIGTVGSQLSGGQKQRIAIARAIVKNPKILILDEATSALDRKSEVEVQAALDKVMSEGDTRLTVVVIAHRLATIRTADVIHFITTDEVKGSTIAESGSYDELMALEGHFAAVASRQMQGTEGKQQQKQNPTVASAGRDHPNEPVTVEGGSSSAFGGGGGGTTAVVISPDGLSTRQPTRAIQRRPSVGKKGEPSLSSSSSSDSDADAKGGDATRRHHHTLAPLVAAEEEDKKAKVPNMRILKMNKPHWWALVFGVLGSLVSGAVYPAYSVIFGSILNVMADNADNPPELRRQIPLWACLFIVIGFASMGGWLLQTFYAYAGEKLTSALRIMLFRNILRQDQAFFDTPGRDAGALAGLLSGDTEAVHQLWGPPLGQRIQQMCNLCVGLIIAFAYSWHLALVAMCAIPALAIVGALQQVFTVGVAKKGDDGGSGGSNGPAGEVNEDSVKAETFTNIRTVVSFNLQYRRMALYKGFLDAESATHIRNSFVMGFLFGLMQFTFFGIFSLTYWYGGRLVQRGEVDFRDVMIVSSAVLMGAMGAGEAGGFAAKMKEAEMGAKRVFSVIDRVPGIDPNVRGDCDIDPNVPAAIGLDRVEFRYPSRPAAKILKKLSSSFPAGSTNGFMGSTGCGKSTVIQLLARYYEYSKGSITVDGKDLTSLDLVEWRKNMSIVLQEPSLFSGTVRENIRYSKPDATEEEIVEAAKLACIHDDILSWPEGYDTDVGYKGRALSGGQKQRVAIARGLLRKPKLLLLDEATSALDNATEAKVQEGINTAYARHPMTIVSVAHRLTTIRDADKIIVMDAGIIIEEGNHDELMALNGEYKVRWELYCGGTYVKRV